MKITFSIQLLSTMDSFPKPNVMCTITLWNAVTCYEETFYSKKVHKLHN